MLDRLRHVRLSAVALALYALAMLVVGFAHGSIGPAGADNALATLALQADAPLSLCAHDGGVPAGPRAANHICDACALTAAPGLPPADTCALPAPSPRNGAPVFARAGQFAPAALHAPLSRGPPAA